MVAAAGLAVGETPSVTIRSVESSDPWVATKGDVTVTYAVDGIDPTLDYKVSFDVTANGVTRGVTNAAHRLAEGEQPAKTIGTTALFGGETTDAHADLKVTLIAVKPDVPSEPADYLLVNLNENGDGKFVTTTVSLTPEAAAARFNSDDTYKTSWLVLRKVAAGYYTVGDDREDKNPRRTVYTDGFWIGIFPVTKAQGARVYREGGGLILPYTGLSYKQIRGTTNASDTVTSGGFLGILSENCVDEYGRSVSGFDLPTEFQWEIACRAGTTGKWCCGDESTFLDRYAVYAQPTDGSPVAVGTKQPNAWGLYDCHGNVLEWCRDAYKSEVPSAILFDADIANAESSDRRSVRGGRYHSTASDCASSYRSSAYLSGGSISSVGFRIFKTP